MAAVPYQHTLLAGVALRCCWQRTHICFSGVKTVLHGNFSLSIQWLAACHACRRWTSIQVEFANCDLQDAASLALSLAGADELQLPVPASLSHCCALPSFIHYIVLTSEVCQALLHCKHDEQGLLESETHELLSESSCIIKMLLCWPHTPSASSFILANIQCLPVFPEAALQVMLQTDATVLSYCKSQQLQFFWSCVFTAGPVLSAYLVICQCTHSDLPVHTFWSANAYNTICRCIHGDLPLHTL